MNNYPHTCVICGGNVWDDYDCEEVSILPPVEDVDTNLVHKCCLEKIKESHKVS